MPRSTNIHTILIIGSGPIVIGQACEFDYSGTQACRALLEEGFRVVLVNSNPATIMTDPSMAHRTYIEPLTAEVAEQIIIKEKPDALLATLGGQTALNLAMQLHENGVLQRHGVTLLGANAAVIARAEDRQLFKETAAAIGLQMPFSKTVSTVEAALQTALQTGYPCIVRPSFTMGGTGGGIARNPEELKQIAARGLQCSLIGEVLIETSLIGWKEFELEVMRDKNDNAIVVCSIENLDPMGVHTGDSITVAPAQTLHNRLYQQLRTAALQLMQAVGVETGGANVQFAVHPHTESVMLIELNPRVSRSSALASKATGYPIARFAAKLAVGYTLDELQNQITRTNACFEPAIDYCVVKIPRFNFDKFPDVTPRLGTSMHAVGEVMAIGRTFKEALQKGIRSMENGRMGLFADDSTPARKLTPEFIAQQLETPTPDRLFYLAQAFLSGFSLPQVYELTQIDPWFLHQIQQLCCNTPSDLKTAKQQGFSDRQVAQLFGLPNEQAVRALRLQQNITPVYRLVDTCAAEFEAYTPYYYATWETECESKTNSNSNKALIIGSGPNRIGQGIEFDYCCVHAALACRQAGWESIMVNCNPETVSTDFDISDRLYFEPLTLEDLLHICQKEQPDGVMVQFGGQTPLNLTQALHQARIPILGTPPHSIALAEDRAGFRQVLAQLGLRQPLNAIAAHPHELETAVSKVGFPAVVRPSFVLGGAKMRLLHNPADLQQYLAHQHLTYPLLTEQFLHNAIEIDVDALSDGERCLIAGIMEHVEPAGIHSGDSNCVFPAYTLPPHLLQEIKEATRLLALKLQVKGLLNIQFAVQDNLLYVIEVNPRASRTIPFISKATGIAWANMAAQVLLGKSIAGLQVKEVQPPYFSVKTPVFPFDRFAHTAVVLGPEMRSTGEVMGIDHNLGMAFYKALWASGVTLPKQGTAWLGLQPEAAFTNILNNLGFGVLTLQNMPRHEALACLSEQKINLVLDADIDMATAAYHQKIPAFTTYRAAQLACHAIKSLQTQALEVKPLQEWHNMLN